MKFNFKPLSSFFRAITKAEEDDTTTKDKGSDQGKDQGDTDDDQGEDQGDTDDDQGEDQGNTDDDQGNKADESKKDAKKASITIAQARYESLVAAEAELKKFGETADDRAKFMKDATQLGTWYANAQSAGATSKTDANAQEKGRKVSKITAEAREAYQKAAEKAPKPTK